MCAGDDYRVKPIPNYRLDNRGFVFIMSDSVNRGSEWKSWDLHLHSPLSHMANQFDVDMSEYIKLLSNSEISVFGITNYFCFANDELEMIREGLRRKNTSKTVMGNLEFRIAQPNKSGEFINIHVLFSEKLETREINSIMARLPLVNTADAGGSRSIYCSEEDIKKPGQGFDKVLVSLKELVLHLKKSLDADKYLIGCCPSGYGSFRPSRGEGRGAGLAEEIDKVCHFAFGNTEDRKFFLNESRYSGARKKPVFSGCDAHNTGELFRRSCWIKAHPTFDGLRQTIFEPEARVCLDNNNPRNAYPKPYFDSINIHGAILQGEELSFSENKIPLNQDLVTIIGGRGTGKSIFLDCLFKQLNHHYKPDQRLAKIEPNKFEVSYTKQNQSETIEYKTPDQGSLSYLHVRQGDIRRIAEEPEALSVEIKSLLNILEHEVDEYHSEEMRSLLSRLSETKRWFLQEDFNGNKTNSKRYNEDIIKNNSARIETITSKENRALVEQYNANAKEISEINLAKSKVESFSNYLKRIEDEFKTEALSVNSHLRSLNVKVPFIDFATQRTSIQTARTKLSESLDEKQKANSQIKEQLSAQGIEQDPAGLLDKVSIYQKNISDAQQRLTEHEQKVLLGKSLIEKRKTHAEAIMSAYEESAKKINEAFYELKKGKDGWNQEQTSLVTRLLDGVNVKGEVFFDREEFYEVISKVINGRKFRATGELTQKQRVLAKIPVKNFSDFVNLLSGVPLIPDDNGGVITAEELSRQSEYFIDGEGHSILELLYLPEFQRKYIKVRAVIEYKGKKPEKLSVGQRGTLYVCMKLATDPFGSPFVFDQPEDDLDNEFVVNELVPLIREIKKYRQIIIVTHNANLVVNADAEQVVVASNVNEELSYVAGAIEDDSVKSRVCRILEGGEVAFKKRESKYGIMGSF